MNTEKTVFSEFKKRIAEIKSARRMVDVSLDLKIVFDSGNLSQEEESELRELILQKHEALYGAEKGALPW